MIKLDDLHSDLLNLIINKGNKYDKCIIRFVNKKYNNIVKYNKIVYYKILPYFVKQNYLRLLIWWRANNFHFEMHLICYQIFDYKRIDIIRWIRNDKLEYQKYLIRHAIVLKWLDILKILYANGYQFNDPQYWCLASERGFLEILEWLNKI